jgi:hypothetical protein
MKDIEKLSFNYTVTNEMKIKVPEKEIKAIIKRELSYSAAKFIFEHLNELPIKQEVIEGVRDMTQDHRISFYMISADELKRLKEIERLYLPLSFEPI